VNLLGQGFLTSRGSGPYFCGYFEGVSILLPGEGLRWARELTVGGHRLAEEGNVYLLPSAHVLHPPGVKKPGVQD
jgi:hypothetical protein